MNFFLKILFLFTCSVVFSQQKSSFKDGEFLKFKMSYSGFLKAGDATLNVKEEVLNGQNVYHVIGKGWTTGAIKWFFKVEDNYESYIDKQSMVPLKFLRNIDEGGYKKNVVVNFDRDKNLAHVRNLRKKRDTTINIDSKVQDLVSSYYYLRNTYAIEDFKKNKVVDLDMFFDNETYKFRLRYLGEEIINTTFGKISALKFRPSVMAGRVFNEEESLTLWVSADGNKIPLKIKADLSVGSLRADLYEYKGLKYKLKLEN